MLYVLIKDSKLNCFLYGHNIFLNEKYNEFINENQSLFHAKK